jgi:DNA-binding MarR family transcriptional regulator
MQLTESTISRRDYEIIADFRYALRKFFKFSEDAAAKLGLTAQQYQALLAIRGYSGDTLMTVGDLAERLQLKPHSAVALVNRLVRKKLVVRLPASRDRRQVFLDLTDEGNSMLERLAGVHREELRSLRAQLDRVATYLED